jgi:hypothetical protein
MAETKACTYHQGEPMRCDQQDHDLVVFTPKRAKLVANLLFVCCDLSVPPPVLRRTFETLIHAFVCKKQVTKIVLPSGSLRAMCRGCRCYGVARSRSFVGSSWQRRFVRVSLNLGTLTPFCAT